MIASAFLGFRIFNNCQLGEYVPASLLSTAANCNFCHRWRMRKTQKYIVRVYRTHENKKYISRGMQKYILHSLALYLMYFNCVWPTSLKCFICHRFPFSYTMVSTAQCLQNACTICKAILHVVLFLCGAIWHSSSSILFSQQKYMISLQFVCSSFLEGGWTEKHSLSSCPLK